MASNKNSVSTTETGAKASAVKSHGKKAAVKKTSTSTNAKKGEAKVSVAKVSKVKSAAKKTSTAKLKSVEKAAAKKAPAKKTKGGAVKSKAAETVKKPSSKPVVKKTGTVSSASATATTTTNNDVRLVVKHDAGFGNQLFIRGNAPGLSWDRGVAMENTSADEWVWRKRRSSKAYEVKILVNDHHWENGENIIIKSKKVVHYPTF